MGWPTPTETIQGKSQKVFTVHITFIVTQMEYIEQSRSYYVLFLSGKKICLWFSKVPE